MQRGNHQCSRQGKRERCRCTIAVTLCGQGSDAQAAGTLREGRPRSAYGGSKSAWCPSRAGEAARSTGSAWEATAVLTSLKSVTIYLTQACTRPSGVAAESDMPPTGPPKKVCASPTPAPRPRTGSHLKFVHSRSELRPRTSTGGAPCTCLPPV